VKEGKGVMSMEEPIIRGLLIAAAGVMGKVRVMWWPVMRDVVERGRKRREEERGRGDHHRN